MEPANNVIGAYVYEGVLPGLHSNTNGHRCLCPMFAWVRECTPIYSEARNMAGWHIPRLSAVCMASGVASWVRFILPGGHVVNAPLKDLGITPRWVVAFRDIITIEDARVYVPAGTPIVIGGE